MPSAKTPIVRRNTDAAIRDTLNQAVADGRITWQAALAIGANANGVIVPAIKELRQKGYSPGEVTEYLNRKIGEATTPSARFSAELYAAAWGGLQADAREMGINP